MAPHNVVTDFLQAEQHRARMENYRKAVTNALQAHLGSKFVELAFLPLSGWQLVFPEWDQVSTATTPISFKALNELLTMTREAAWTWLRASKL